MCEKAFDLSRAVLKNGGNFLVKIFQGGDFPAFYKLVGESFKVCKTEKPQSSRKESFEVYIVGLGKF